MIESHEQEHPYKQVWESLPTETLEAEHERITERLVDLTSRSETLGNLIGQRALVEEV